MSMVKTIDMGGDPRKSPEEHLCAGGVTSRWARSRLRSPSKMVCKEQAIYISFRSPKSSANYTDILVKAYPAFVFFVSIYLNYAIFYSHFTTLW